MLDLHQLLGGTDRRRLKACGAANGFGDIQNGNAFEDIEAFADGLCVTGAAFRHHRFGDVEIELFAVPIPPIPCELLICSGYQIPTRP